MHTVSQAFAFISGIVKTHHIPEAEEALEIIRQSLHFREPVDPKDTMTDDYLICLEDGAKLKMLKRYIWTNYGLTPDAYRKKWNLPRDYPMTAPNYSKLRSKMAKDIGLGTKPTSKKKRAA
jgi:predicted transcriptional regulator